MDMLLIADDNMDGQKLAVTNTGKVLIFDPSENAIAQDLNTTFSKYIEGIRDGLLLRSLSYEGEELGLVSSAWKIFFLTKYLYEYSAMIYIKSFS